MAVYQSAPEFGIAPPPHALTPEAELARGAVADYSAARRASRIAEDGGAIVAGPHPRAIAERVGIESLTGSPKTAAAKLSAAGARLAVTRSVDGGALSLWVLTADGRRARALYRRTATGWGSQGVIIDGRAYGVTVALVALIGPKL
jgi:hypothetical protein